MEISCHICSHDFDNDQEIFEHTNLDHDGLAELIHVLRRAPRRTQYTARPERSTWQAYLELKPVWSVWETQPVLGLDRDHLPYGSPTQNTYFRKLSTRYQVCSRNSTNIWTPLVCILRHIALVPVEHVYQAAKT